MDSKGFEYKLFTKGQMDSDISPELLENGKYRYALNFRPYNTETKSVGIGTNYEGNKEVTYDFELGENAFIRVIGSKLDLKRSRMYYMVYAFDETLPLGEGEKAYVLYYDYLTEEIVTIFNYDNVLGFSKDGVIQSVDIVYDDVLGDTLYWTDDITEPKKLNVTAAYNRFNRANVTNIPLAIGQIYFADFEDEPFTQALLTIPCECIATTLDTPLYNYNTGSLTDTVSWRQMNVNECYPPTLLETMFTQKVITPYYSPVSRYRYEDTDEGLNLNISRRSYQTRYKYVYFDGEESEWSPISDAVFSQQLPAGIFAPNSLAIADLQYPIPSELLVRIPIGLIRATGATLKEWVFNPHAMISRVRVCIREVPDNLAPLDWYEFANIPMEEFWKYNISANLISTSFPANESGTYFFDYDSRSYLVPVTGFDETARVVTIDLKYDATQTLIPTDIKDQATNFYIVPRKSNAQCYVDNRIVHGAVLDQYNVSKETIDSFQNVSLSAVATIEDIATENTLDTINQWNEFPTGAVIITGNQATFVYNTSTAFNAANYTDQFFYDFTIRFDINVSGRNRQTAIRFSGTCDGIPSQFANWDAFLESVIEGTYELLGGFITLFVAANNTTGQLALTAVTSGFASNAINSASSSIRNFDENDDLVASVGFYRVSSYLPARTFKNHTKQTLGFAIQDTFGRLTPIITTDNMSVDIPHFINNNLEEVSYKIRVAGLSDVILPEYAQILHVYRKRSGSYSNYIQFALSKGNCPTQSWNNDKQFEIGILNLDLDDFNSNSNALSITQNNYLYITLNSVNGGDGFAYQTLFDVNEIGFAPRAGDLFRILYRQDSDGTIIEKYNYAFPIAQFSDTWNTVAIDFTDIQDKDPYLADFLQDSTTNTERILCEIVKRPTETENEFYWENAMQIFVKDGTPILREERPIFIFGDAYLKLRGQCVFYNKANPSGSALQNFSLIDRNYSDFFRSANVGEGRANIQSRTVQSRSNIYSEILSENLMRYSEQSIQNTDKRNFAKIYDSNIQQVDNVFGRIELLHAEGDTVRIYQEDKRAIVYVGRGVTTELSGAQRLIATQNQVFSDVIYEQGEYGISKESTSFATAGYRKYFTDSKRGMVYRQSLDGITPISEVGMSGYFKQLFSNVRRSYTPALVRGIVDLRTDEYILSVTYAKRFIVEAVDVVTLFFSFYPPEGANYINQFQSGDTVQIDPSPSAKFRPQSFNVIGNQEEDGKITCLRKPGSPPTANGDLIEVEYPVTETLVFSERTGGWTTFLSFDSEWMSEGIQSYHTFVNGQMWIHELENTDYNTFHDREFNTEIEVVSNRDAMTTKEWRTMGVKINTPDIEVSEDGIATSLEQNSRIPQASFKFREGTYWTPFYRNSNESLQSGSRLKGRWLSTRLTITAPDVNNRAIKIAGFIFNSNESAFPL
jgi:hypothetical protein